MKKCPNCGELVGDNAAKCFACHFDMTNPEANKLAEQNRVQREREAIEKKQREEAERQRIAEENRIKAIRENNNLYEYDIVSIPDLQTGESNTSMIASVITQHAQNGWKLHTIYTNEIGKTSHPQAFGISTINATIEQTIIVFERVIAKANS